MKKINDHWVDENNNSWGLQYSKEEALKKSKSLINCSGCSDCSGCSRCFDFNSNPFRFFIQNIGSRQAETKIYWDCFGNTQIICGCFKGNIFEFMKKVLKTHKENEHYIRYNTLIDSVFNLMEI